MKSLIMGIFIPPVQNHQRKNLLALPWATVMQSEAQFCSLLFIDLSWPGDDLWVIVLQM